MITQRAALHVAYFIATGRENPGPTLAPQTPDDVLREITSLGHVSTFEAAKDPAIVAEYKTNGVRAAAALLKQKGLGGA